MLKPVEKPIKFVKNLSTKGKSYPITHVSAVIDDNGESIKSTIDSLKNKSSMTEVTWQELKDKRDAGKLTPGTLYRITDYNCTTTQENTRSAGHQFDIVLLALSENKLAEEGWAMMHDNIYDVTFDDGVTKKCWIYDNGNNPMAKYNIVDAVTLKGLVISMHTIEIDEEHKTAVVDSYYSDDLEDEGLTYDYFQNSNLSAWKVWYCLDNDKSRFAWADDSVIGDIENVVVHYPERTNFGQTIPAHDVFYTLTNETQIVNGVTYFKLIRLEIVHTGDRLELFVNTKNINTETTLYEFEPRSGTVQALPFSIKSINYNTPPTEEGRGVIYRLIDEFNNDIKYDFKNIQFLVKIDMETGYYDEEGDDTYVYSLNAWIDGNIMDASIVGNTLQNDVGIIDMVAYNTIELYPPVNQDAIGYALPYNVILTSNEDGEGYYGANHIYFDGYTFNNSVNSPCYDIRFMSNSTKNTLPGGFGHSSFFNCHMMTEAIGNTIYLNNKKVLTES